MRRRSLFGGRPVAITWLLAALFVASCGAEDGSLRPVESRSDVLDATDAPDASATDVPLASSLPSASAPAGVTSPGASAAPSQPGPPFRLTATAFIDGGGIPREYTCDGSDVSPALAWSGAPAGTSALVLLLEDPDAGNFVHWMVLDLPGAATGTIAREIAGDAATPLQGRDDFGRIGWGGPCPPSGTHHYRFTLLALDAPLDLTGHPDATVVRAALAKATVLGRAILEATYRRL